MVCSIMQQEANRHHHGSVRACACTCLCFPVNMRTRMRVRLAVTVSICVVPGCQGVFCTQNADCDGDPPSQPPSCPHQTWDTPQIRRGLEQAATVSHPNFDTYTLLFAFLRNVKSYTQLILRCPNTSRRVDTRRPRATCEGHQREKMPAKEGKLTWRASRFQLPAGSARR